MSRVFVLCILLPTVLGNTTGGGTLTVKAKDDQHLKIIKLKDIPSSIINEHLVQAGDDKSKLVTSDKKVNLPDIIHIKPINLQITSKPKNIKKKKLKLKKLKSKRKQLKRLIKKNNIRQRKLKKLKLKNKPKIQKRNKWKKQMRNIPSNRFTSIIDRIMSYHNKGKGLKVSTQEIRQRILNLLTANKRVLKPGKDCRKPNIGKGVNVLRKRLRSLKRSKFPRKRPTRVVIFKGNRGKGSRIPGNKRDGRTKIYNTKEKKANVKSNMTIRIDKKKKKKVNNKKSLRKRKQRKETNV